MAPYRAGHLYANADIDDANDAVALQPLGGTSAVSPRGRDSFEEPMRPRFRSRPGHVSSTGSVADDEMGESEGEEDGPHPAGITAPDDGPWAGVEIKKWMRVVAFTCSVLTGVGGHFAAHTLGPLKDQVKEHLGITNAQFGLMQASLSVVPTIMPFLGGLFVDRFGTGSSSFIAISLILAGQLLVVYGAFSSLFGWMVGGYIVFGIGEGWLVVISETVLVHFFHGRGLALMLGLYTAIGKCASFLATGTSIHVTEWTGFYGNAFVVGAALCLASWGINFGYLALVRHLNQSARDGHGVQTSNYVPLPILDRPDDLSSTDLDVVPMERLDSKAAKAARQASGRGVGIPTQAPKRVDVAKVLRFSDVVWFFFLVCVLFGSVWIPLIHLSANIAKVEFGLLDAQAAWLSSLVFALPMVLNPLMGLAVDRAGRLMWWALASALCLMGATGLLLYPLFTSPVVALVLFALSISVGPLAQITAIPLMLPPQSTHRDIGTVLGIRRCVEHIGATLVDTLSGALQDAEVDHRYTYVLQVFFGIACLATLAVLVWARLDRSLLGGILAAPRTVRPDLIADLSRSYALYGNDLANHPALQPSSEVPGPFDPRYYLPPWPAVRLRKRLYVLATVFSLAVSWAVFWVAGLHALFRTPTSPLASVRA
ncbi:hypothetical protein IWQ60_003368 [Tieghemiomyces parasiticus]|uniref:Lysosomal dipeptide transporter MFSD1 n=1 Tax=Tieghemiomyces parasiticus TaxID=78921 RepID=A0A9W8AAC7_9FUNG|nr:hypothetical protein IWQ60_003368 [Tieghemiomyces parasiticus]